MPTLVKPHGGGPLKPLLLHGAALAHEGKRALSLPRIPVTSRDKGDLLMLGIGGFTPLTGFMTHADWKDVYNDYRTADGLFWPIPITLSASRPLADPIRINDEVALMDAESGSLLATMTVTEKYSIDKAHECKSVFRTTDIDHPGVKMVMEQGEVNLAGPLKVISEGGFREKCTACFI